MPSGLRGKVAAVAAKRWGNTERNQVWQGSDVTEVRLRVKRPGY